MRLSDYIHPEINYLKEEVYKIGTKQSLYFCWFYENCLLRLSFRKKKKFFYFPMIYYLPFRKNLG